MAKAFLTGGLICVLGQALMNAGMDLGLNREDAGSWCSLLLVLLSALLTGWNIYPKLARFGGAGTLVPITGFANSVAAAAVEYQTEGEVFGKGSKIFLHRRPGNPLRNFQFLGAGPDLLAWKNPHLVVK